LARNTDATKGGGLGRILLRTYEAALAVSVLGNGKRRAATVRRFFTQRTVETANEKGGSFMSAIYEEVKFEDLSPEEKLRGEPESEIEVPGAQKSESAEVKKEINPNTE
jgi:hypothetical protein